MDRCGCGTRPTWAAREITVPDYDEINCGCDCHYVVVNEADHTRPAPDLYPDGCGRCRAHHSVEAVIKELDAHPTWGETEDEWTMPDAASAIDAAMPPPGLPPLTSVPMVPSVTAGPTRSPITGRAATESQMNFIRTLVAERDPADDYVAAVATALAEDWAISAKQASGVIEKLLKIPKTNPGFRPNSYPGQCGVCGGEVAAHAGWIQKQDTGLARGKWVTFHKDGECLTGAAKAEAEADRVTEPGMYAKDGTYYRVRKGRYDKTVLWAERAIPISHGSIVFRKAGRASSIGLKASDRLDWKTARKLGVAYSACINCGRSLSDDRSLVAGYGETCAGHNGWPYPTQREASDILAGILTWGE